MARAAGLTWTTWMARGALGLCAFAFGVAGPALRLAGRATAGDAIEMTAGCVGAVLLIVLLQNHGR